MQFNFFFLDYELFSQESRKRKFIPVINHPDIGDEMLKDDVRWKLAKNPGINTWTAIAKTWSQYDNAMDNAKCMFLCVSCGSVKGVPHNHFRFNQFNS